jgi:hypothetical protein
VIGRRTLIVAVVVVGVAATLIELSSRSSASQSAGLFSCTTSTDHGACVFPQDTADFPGINPGSGRPASQGIEVDQNEWSGGTGSCSGSTQTLSANSPENYQVVANYPAGNTAVCTYPNVWPHDAQGAVDSYSQTTSSFSESFPHNAQTTAWAMFDLWFNNWANEVMIQYDFSDNGPCQTTPVTDVTFGGSNGVPSQPWFLCTFGSPMANGSYQTTAWKLGPNEAGKESESSGSIDMLAMIKYLEGTGYLPANSTWTAISMGWEIASTGGTNETFTGSGFTVNMGPSSSSPAHGYWLAGSDGGIFNFGSAGFDGSTGSLRLQRPVVGMTRTPSNSGYWLVASDGGVFAFNAPYVGSLPGLGLHPAGSGLPNSLNEPIVGMVPSANGQGYYMVGADGGVFAFNATFAGSCPGIGVCSGAAVAVTPDASGNGYWLATATGHVYSFGDARFFGAPGPQSSTITSMVRTPDGGGYYLLDANGQVFAYGDADSSLGGLPAGAAGGLDPATAIIDTDSGEGYWITTALGKVYPFGDAPALGDMSGTHLNGPIVAATGF